MERGKLPVYNNSSSIMENPIIHNQISHFETLVKMIFVLPQTYIFPT